MDVGLSRVAALIDEQFEPCVGRCVLMRGSSRQSRGAMSKPNRLSPSCLFREFQIRVQSHAAVFLGLLFLVLQ